MRHAMTTEIRRSRTCPWAAPRVMTETHNKPAFNLNGNR